MPEAVLRLIGPEGLEKIADQARRDCLSEHIRRAITRWYANEAKLGRVKSLIDLGAAMGCSKATASRYVRGQIRQTDLLQADLYLRRLGMSLKIALPSEEEIRFAILAATIRAFHQARVASTLDCIAVGELITPEQILAIERINQKCPFTEVVTQSETHWQEWLSKAAAFVRAAFPLAKWPEGGPKQFTWEICAALMAADWQVAKKYLPWQVLAVLTSVIEVADALGVRTNPDDVTKDRHPFLFHRTSAGDSIQYAPIDHDLSITLAELCRIEKLPVVALALAPRPERMAEYGSEFTECWIVRANSGGETTIPVSLHLEIAVVPKSDESAVDVLAGGLSDDAVETFYRDGLFERVKTSIEDRRGEVQTCRGRRIAARHWALDVEATLPASLTLRRLQRLVDSVNQDKLKLARDVTFRLQFCESGVWDEMWRHGAIGNVSLWQEDGNEPAVHRAEFWTAVWGDDEISPWALFRAIFDTFEGNQRNDSPAALLQHFGITPDRIDEWRRVRFFDAADDFDESDEKWLVLRKLLGGWDYVYYGRVFAPRTASLDARLVMSRVSLICMKFGHRTENLWHLALALSTVDQVATRLTDIGVNTVDLRSAIEAELLQRQPAIVPIV